MIKHIYDKNGMTLIRTTEATPVCSEDFCDACGDCLVCYGEDICYETATGQHIWVEYLEE